MFISYVGRDNTAVFFYPDPNPREVFVTGSFCGWEIPGYPLRNINGSWMGEIHNFPQGEFEYKFIVDGNWVKDPHNVIARPDNTGGENSIITHRQNRGSVYHFSFYSPAINEQKGYVIYLPPGYFLSDDHYSTVYLLHGMLDWEYTWIHRGLVHYTLDYLHATGRIGEIIVVLPRENGEFFHGDGRYADYIGRDLVGHIDMEFKTIPAQKHRAIDGLSTGAFVSMILGASFPDKFSSIGAMSGSYDRRVFEAVRHNADALKRYNLRFYISCGKGDPSVKTSRALASTLRNEGLIAEYHENPGPHDWEFWGPSVAGNIEFHWWSFQR